MRLVLLVVATTFAGPTRPQTPPPAPAPSAQGVPVEAPPSRCLTARCVAV